MTIFMERLQKLMDERNLTDKELREQCGDISKNSITNWRNGTKPQKAIVHKLADFFVPPLSAYPNPSLYGVRYSFKQEDTPYHNGRECLSFVHL